jgi:hypothetical protein
VFQRIPDPLNGTLREEGRTDGIGAWFDLDSIKVSPQRFAGIKSARAFMNDPVDQLYLATHLWSKTFATMVSHQVEESLPALLQVTVDEMTDDLREGYGRIRKADVRRAMKLLQAAKLAEAIGDDEWQLAWDKLHVPGERELERVLARRVCNPPATTRLARLRRIRPLKGDKLAEAGQQQLGLFDVRRQP